MPERKELLTTNEAIAAIPTNKSTFVRAVEKLDIPNIKIPNDRKRYYRSDDVELLRKEIFKNKIIVTNPDPSQKSR